MASVIIGLLGWFLPAVAFDAAFDIVGVQRRTRVTRLDACRLYWLALAVTVFVLHGTASASGLFLMLPVALGHIHLIRTGHGRIGAWDLARGMARQAQAAAAWALRKLAR